MTDETENTEEVFLFFGGGQQLQARRWGSHSNSHQETQIYLALKNEIEGKLAKGEPVYCQIMDERRRGSVGRISEITFDFRPAGTMNSYYRSNLDYLGINGIKVTWDGRSNKCSPYADEVEYLANWSGGTQWQWHKGEPKEKPEKVVAYDSLGQEIEVGQFVCFVHRRYGNISMKFGSVTRMTDKGTVFVKSLKLRDGERGGEELKALSANDLLIVNDKLMGRLMMARLSAD